LRIRVTGPESSGKSTLARALAWALDGHYVAEQARSYLGERGGHYERGDLIHILHRQLEAEQMSSASVLCCDTGPEVLRIWSEVKYGTCAPALLRAFHEVSYDLTFLCAPDLPWQADPLREHPDPGDRQALFGRYRALLPTAITLRGGDRTEAALRTVMAYLRRS
jgi:nicotinamide riboside kinase